MSVRRPGPEALARAAMWLREGYEGDPSDDENVAMFAAVADWLDALAERQHEDATARVYAEAFAAKTGRSASDPQVRAAARRIARRQAEEDAR